MAGAVDRSLAVLAERDEGREIVDEAAEFLLRLCALAVDQAAASGNPYAVAALAGRIIELLRDLRMTPAARGVKVEASPLAELLSLLRDPEVRDTP